METDTATEIVKPRPNYWETLKVIAYILGTLLLFFFALDLMISSFQHLGSDIVQAIIQTTLNPFTGLFIGLLITALLQSSSTTTALVVALVASGSLSLQSAVPIIMGANIGTTITSTIVSLGFISEKKEFRRAVAAGTYHCFFNLLTVVILFPLEYYYGFLSSLSEKTGTYLFSSTANSETQEVPLPGFNPIIDFLLNYLPQGIVLIVLSFVLLFGSILLFRRVISNLLKARSPEVFSRFFFRNQFKSFGWGVITTAAIRSSTITTSVVVPIVAKKITTLRQAAPFIMGANVGTTVTALIAAILNTSNAAAISIAIAHILFNVIGVVLFFPVKALRNLPIALANGLGKLTLRYPLICFVFILLTFFFIPFVLIYFNQDKHKTFELTYEFKAGLETSHYRIVSRVDYARGTGEWIKYGGLSASLDEKPELIYPIHIKTNSLFIGDDIYLLNKPGFCWDGEDTNGKFEACVSEIVEKRVDAQNFDSVFVFDIRYSNEQNAAFNYTISVAAPEMIVLERSYKAPGHSTTVTETLIDIQQ